MLSSKDPGKPMGIMALIISLFGIALTLFEKTTWETFILLLVLTTCAIVFAFLAFYVKTTNKNSKEIETIKENFKFETRLNKLENKVFENEQKRKI